MTLSWLVRTAKSPASIRTVPLPRTSIFSLPELVKASLPRRRSHEAGWRNRSSKPSRDSLPSLMEFLIWESV